MRHGTPPGGRASFGRALLAGIPLQERHRVHAERLADPVEHRFDRALSPQHTARCGGQQLGLGAGPGGLPGAAGRGIHDRADQQGYHYEHAQGQRVVRLGDGELVNGRYEVVVE